MEEYKANRQKILDTLMKEYEVTQEQAEEMLLKNE